MFVCVVRAAAKLSFGQRTFRLRPSAQHHTYMEQDPELSYTTYMSAADHIALHGLRSDASVAEVPLGHTLISGTSQGSMIATIGHSPHSLIIINDWHEPD